MLTFLSCGGAIRAGGGGGTPFAMDFAVPSAIYWSGTVLEREIWRISSSWVLSSSFFSFNFRSLAGLRKIGAAGGCGISAETFWGLLLLCESCLTKPAGIAAAVSLRACAMLCTSFNNCSRGVCVTTRSLKKHSYFFKEIKENSPLLRLLER